VIVRSNFRGTWSIAVPRESHEVVDGAVAQEMSIKGDEGWAAEVLDKRSARFRFREFEGLRLSRKVLVGWVNLVMKE
jgi:hypothetical protein